MPLYSDLAWHNPFSPKEIAKIPTERVLELRCKRKQKLNRKIKPKWSKIETARIKADIKNARERQKAYFNFKFALERTANRVHRSVIKSTAYVCP